MYKQDKFFISAWTRSSFDKSPDEKLADWYDLGLTVGMMHFKDEDKPKVKKMLDLAHEKGMKLILCDSRADWKTLTAVGEEKYRIGLADAIAEFGSHPATFGFYIGDEPNAPDFDDAMLAVKINNEMAPHLKAYINLLPWFDWISETMGTKEYAPYLDRVVNEGNCTLYSYDCYVQMYDDKRGYDDYFNNLREYYLASKRNNVPFVNVVLSSGHFDYRCPSKDDMWWQLNTSVAHGAKGISWFLIDMDIIHHNYRNMPINQLGERTEQFAWLSEVNRLFMKYCGKVINTLTIDKCYHVCKAYGGMPLFEPFANLLSVESRNDIPLIVSDFYNDSGEHFYMICNNSPEDNAYISIRVKEGVRLTRCNIDNTVTEISVLTDPIGEQFNVPGHSYSFFLSPGQLALLKENL